MNTISNSQIPADPQASTTAVVHIQLLKPWLHCRLLQAQRSRQQGGDN